MRQQRARTEAPDVACVDAVHDGREKICGYPLVKSARYEGTHGLIVQGGRAALPEGFEQCLRQAGQQSRLPELSDMLEVEFIG